jgi:hypothetical protein
VAALTAGGDTGFSSSPPNRRPTELLVDANRLDNIPLDSDDAGVGAGAGFDSADATA